MVTLYGRIVGAWIGTVIFKNDWKKAFVCCELIIISLSLGLFSKPQKYYSTKYMIVEQKKAITGNVVEKIVPIKDNDNTDINTDTEIKKDIKKIKNINYINEEQKHKSSLSNKESENLDKMKKK